MLYSVVYVKINGEYSSLAVEKCSLTQTQSFLAFWQGGEGRTVLNGMKN